MKDNKSELIEVKGRAMFAAYCTAHGMNQDDTAAVTWTQHDILKYTYWLIENGHTAYTS